MKINYKNTALGLIDDPKNFEFGFPDGVNGGGMTPHKEPTELLTFGRSIIDTAEQLKQMCGGNIQLVSRTFWNAYARGKHKLNDVFDKEEITEGGIIILPSEGITHTYYYFVNAGLFNGTWAYQLLFMDFAKRSSHGNGPALDTFISVSVNENGEEASRKQLIWNGHIHNGFDAGFWEAMIITFILFKRYCDIETKEVSPKNRRAKVGDTKYLNETDKRIKILDATWFTNLVVSGKFEVDGHLHWYWTGPNRSIRRLQWVNTYEKNGYTRKAKAITNKEQY